MDLRRGLRIDDHSAKTCLNSIVGVGDVSKRIVIDTILGGRNTDRKANPNTPKCRCNTRSTGVGVDLGRIDRLNRHGVCIDS